MKNQHYWLGLTAALMLLPFGCGENEGTSGSSALSPSGIVALFQTDFEQDSSAGCGDDWLPEIVVRENEVECDNATPPGPIAGSASMRVVDSNIGSTKISMAFTDIDADGGVLVADFLFFIEKNDSSDKTSKLIDWNATNCASGGLFLSRRSIFVVACNNGNTTELWDIVSDSPVIDCIAGVCQGRLIYTWADDTISFHAAQEGDDWSSMPLRVQQSNSALSIADFGGFQMSLQSGTSTNPAGITWDNFALCDEVPDTGRCGIF